MAVRVLSRDQANELRNQSINTLNALKARIDGLENALSSAEDQQKMSKVQAARVRSAMREAQIQLSKEKKQLNKIDRLLSKGSIRSQGSTVVLQ